jgi:hypothetical protein
LNNQGEKIESLLVSLKKLLKKEGCLDLIKKIDEAISAGSTGTEIYVLLRGALIEPNFGGKCTSAKIENTRKKLIDLIDGSLAPRKI